MAIGNYRSLSPKTTLKEDLIMTTNKRTLTVLIATLGLHLWAGACHPGRTVAEKPSEKEVAPAPSPAPTLTLTAEPGSIQSGNSATLSWTSQNATDLDLQPGVGKVQATGSSSVTPRDSTTFTLTATGPGGTETATARVTVTPLATPPAPVVGGGGGLLTIPVKDVYFDFDEANIRPDAEQVLTTDASFLNDHRSIKFTLEGHCDERGSEEYNLGLGDRRATAAKNFLVNTGVSADRISTISYGKSQPVCADQTEGCWQENRRAHFHYGGESK
jgi:peptidoglycan-associated lipoprotein